MFFKRKSIEERVDKLVKSIPSAKEIQKAEEKRIENIKEENSKLTKNSIIFLELAIEALKDRIKFGCNSDFVLTKPWSGEFTLTTFERLCMEEVFSSKGYTLELSRQGTYCIIWLRD